MVKELLRGLGLNLSNYKSLVESGSPHACHWPHQRVYGRAITIGWAGGWAGGRKETAMSEPTYPRARITKFGRHIIAHPLQFICAKFHDQIRIGKPSKSRSRETTPIRNSIFALMRAYCWATCLLFIVAYLKSACAIFHYLNSAIRFLTAITPPSNPTKTLPGAIISFCVVKKAIPTFSTVT